MSYANIVNFGNNVEKSPNNNPLSYCMTSELDNNFMHTAAETRGPYSQPCQMFMSDYCAKEWNGVCEVASRNTNNQFPNTATPWLCDKNGQGACLGSGIGSQFTQGDNLIRNTAIKKYMSAMSETCSYSYQPFDPLVPTSPMIRYWNKSCADCTPIYEVNPKTIDSDPVMDKLLARPLLGMDIFLNIYNTAKRNGTLSSLKGTKLYNFFQGSYFQKYASISKAKAAQY